MQTFLPYPDFAKSVATLDYKRKGKQRVENLQLIKALKNNGGLHGGWSRHPASRMWEGYLLALLEYQEAVCKNWTETLGFKDTCWVKSLSFFTEEELLDYVNGNYAYPSWLGDPDFHLAHQSNLRNKFPEYYVPQFPDAPDGLPYIWPGAPLEEAKLRDPAVLSKP